MYATLATLIEKLDRGSASRVGVIHWGCPVPSFGNPSRSRVATLGLNPSNREFVDERGNELQGQCRRFHTLQSLGLTSWSDADARHLRLIVDSCNAYFTGNPYDRWFRILDQVVSGTSASYYDPDRQACHLDLIPYATTQKWTALTSRQRAALLALAGDALGYVLRDSRAELLILNGSSVVGQFQQIADVELDHDVMPAWALPRSANPDVTGIAYTGVVDSLCGVDLGRRVLVLGYNHNLQSSFGVTTSVIQAIKSWVYKVTHEFAHETQRS